ncbi:histone deacetylase family protein [Dinoroseobacter shibae DFL 12 = DSM 16493]|uniref:Acetoin utilization protein AcuC n=1 Tax=Dinoroseobacter shibae (strain DSM 16493 / NCIMB 14021 / DFL 12) TaxID=398580 RepID=A8LPT7_DINSH|nr:acetoin utilization protein AcuC [Dinoroseobacter shibae]ABV93791.1 histone deacetylase family protein [Dinoroseobacter shibae DFL 12 = DSM 16493]URF45244.1 acetoin utilization protein AcuC [Dinoroseobacter shibae]URF49549.1 acetoin utilization protein AcuC [Dinoroseobacter shibae]
MTPLFIGAEIYRNSTYGGWHPLRIPRVSTAMDLSRALGWLPRGQYRVSPRAKPAALHIWHDPAYVAALVQAEADGTVSDAVRARHNLGTPSNPVFGEVFRRPATAAGGSMLAGAILGAGPGVVYHPAGGTHHGLPDRANGFCYLNDPVLAMLSLRQAGLRRIAYVDIDAHHCDGVAVAFRGDPDVLMISVHEEKRWPFTGGLEETEGGSALNLPVPRGLNDAEMAFIRDALIVPAVAAFAPEAIVLQCGADAVEEDPLSRLALSNNAHWAVVSALGALTDRYLVLGGGGYNPWTVGRLWAGVWATLNALEIPERLPPEAEAVQRGLSWAGAKMTRMPEPALFTTLRDAPRPGPVRDMLRARVAVLQARSAVLVG